MKPTIALTLCLLLSGCTRRDLETPCKTFFTALDAVPHEWLTIDRGELVSTWDGKAFNGCEVQFESTDSLRGSVPIPDFDAGPASELYGLGWRMSEGIGADGAGSGVFGIERESVACVVRWAQPAHIDDDGNVVQSDTFSMNVQCRDASR